MGAVARNPSVIAGLKCPPEMWPTAETMTAIARPCARAMPTSVGSWMPAADMIEPAPTKISVNVPTNSATPRRIGSVTRPRLERRPDGTETAERGIPPAAEQTDVVGAVFVRQCGTKKGGTMSADQLKRKLRNFPAANLSARLAA